jgi:hypothetical protein
MEGGKKRDIPSSLYSLGRAKISQAVQEWSARKVLVLLSDAPTEATREP